MSNALADTIDEVIVDPKTYGDEHAYHDAFHWLRQNDPVHWSEPADYRPFWAITRHADIMAVELNAANFLNDPRQFLVTTADEDALYEQTGSRKFAENLVAMDNPKHKAYRALTSAWFGAKSLRSLEDEITALARETVDRMIDTGGTCDFASEIAAWYPLRTIMIVLGVPREDEPLMLHLSQKLFGSVGGADGMAGMVEAFNAFNDYFSKVTADRRVNPRNDVATILATATIDGEPIGEAERNAYYLIVAAAGHDTTSSAISGGLLALLRNPAEMAKLRADPDLIGTAVDEFIRWTSPVKHFFRTAVADCEVGGKQIRAGDSLMMCYPSGNRDEAVFEAPFDFRVDRKDAKKHLAFGYGPHLCLGNALAKLEMRILFTELLRRVEDIELAGTPTWVEASFVSGVKSLPISFRAAQVET
ncbi:cytochrome P450 [Sphingobium lactosutens]|uniref:cytochrome P450 n=1 Tax=Sphingobium lactosutens TaxID=522773 RepID=UPI0035628F4F